MREALSVGYRFLDCAEFYGNEAEVGAALAESRVRRDEIYLASKAWTTTIYNGPGAVRSQVLKTIEDLGCGHLNLYCIHWPVPGKHVDAYIELQRLREEGFITSLGVSNYCVEDYKELMDDPRVTVKPVINQIEINPFLYRRKTIEYFQSQGVQLQSYRSLRDGKAFNNPEVLRIAAKYEKSAAQILGRWCVQKGFVYIPKSVRRERMKENMLVLDWSLADEDMGALDGLTTEESLATFAVSYVCSGLCRTYLHSCFVCDDGSRACAMWPWPLD